MSRGRRKEIDSLPRVNSIYYFAFGIHSLESEVKQLSEDQARAIHMTIVDNCRVVVRDAVRKDSEGILG